MNPARVILPLLLTVVSAMAETRVKVTGMKHKSESQVLELMGGRLTHVRSSPASAPLADDAAFLLRQILEKDGYARAEVDWRIIGRDEIVLIVNEGGRQSLGTVTIRGAAEEDVKKLAKLYAKPAEKDRPLAAGAPPFREEDVETGLSYLRQEFNARGHWKAEATVVSREADPATGVVSPVIEVKPGPLYQIAPPTVSSVDGPGVEMAKNAVRPFIGQTATTGNLNSMRVAVEEAATGSGYPDAIIRMTRTLEGEKFIPGFTLEFGKRVKLGDIRIAGLQHTNPERIARRFADMEGDWYDEAAVNKRLREMLSTGAFSSAGVETSDAGEGSLDATLNFKEARAKEVSVAAGIGSYQGLIIRFTYIDRNLLGNLWGFSSGFEYSALGFLGETRVTDPWLFGSDVSASARAYALIYGREGYNAYESGLEGKTKWKFGKHYALELLGGNSVVKLTADGLPSSELGETLYNHARLRFSQSLDFRDNAVLPKSGWHLENPIEIGTALGGVSTSYTRAGLTGGWFREINRRYQVGFGGEWGVLIPGGDGGDLPIDLRLFNGGSRSVRSFPERELGPAVNGFPTGGEAMWNTNAELIRSITGPVKAVAFVDAGTLAREYDELFSTDVELAAGLGIRLDLPIGPVRVEYGHNLTRDGKEPNGTLHFAIGCAY
jgi:outer membrane protein insertion porin family